MERGRPARKKTHEAGGTPALSQVLPMMLEFIGK
jgi:hypothetical protein